MVSTFTPNIQLEEPARGDDVGVWDTPVNSNMTVIDLVTGAIATIPLNNSPIVLSAAQFKSKTIVFGSTLTGNVVITFPASFTKSYEIYNGCTGSSAFTITLQTTAAGAQAICPPPGEFIDAINDGLNIKFKNLGRVGSYFDYAGSSVPAWVSGCTVPPYLNCDGSAFSAVTYPALSVVIGGTTLPDSRGRARFVLDGGTGRISSAATGFSGSSVGASGGSQAITLIAAQIPTITSAGTVNTTPGVNLAGTSGNIVDTNAGSGGNLGAAHIGGTAFGNVTSMSGTFTSNNTGSTLVSELPPAYIGGLTLIRAG